MHLRAGTDEDCLGSTRRIPEDVAASGDAVGRRQPRAVEDRDLLPREHEHGGAAPVRDHRAPRFDRFRRVRRPQHEHARDRPQHRQLLDRLVGGAILSQPDRIVRADIDDRQPHQRREPHRRLHVVGEYEEGAAHRAHPAVGGDAVEGGSHPVLADTPVDLAPGGGGSERSYLLKLRAGAAGKVRRSTCQLRQNVDEP